jgi:hypothetical protein
LLIKPDLPDMLGFLLESAGLALLTVNAWRGSYVYGWRRFLLVTFFSLVTIGIAGALYKVKRASDFILNHVSSNFHLMIPLAFLVLWLAAAAALPFLLGLTGWITGMLVRASRRRK